MKRIGFAYNPTSEMAVELRERALGWCQQHGVQAWARPSEEAHADPEELATTEAVVVLGGDGTLNEVLNGLDDPTRTPIAQLGMGTANLLAHELGLPRDPEPFARGINSFQLFNDGERWWVLTIYWTSERPDLLIPDRYIGKG